MNLRYRKVTTPIALLVTLALGQLYVGAGLAAPDLASSAAEPAPAPVMGILSTRDNKPITVNGASAVTGATIPSGATIQTPDGVSATIKLASMGHICLAPNSKVVVEFDKSSKPYNIKVIVTEGCVILQTLKGTAGMISSSQGSLAQIDPANGGSIDVCLRAGSAPSINQGAAGNAGAGASATDCAVVVAGPILWPWWAAIAGGGAVGLYLLFRGGNPSPSTP